MSEDLSMLRLQSVELLARAYTLHTTAYATQDGYYTGFLDKLYRILYGAAADYGLKPEGFLILSVLAPLGERMQGVAVATENAEFASEENLFALLESTSAFLHGHGGEGKEL